MTSVIHSAVAIDSAGSTTIDDATPVDIKIETVKDDVQNYSAKYVTEARKLRSMTA